MKLTRAAAAMACLLTALEAKGQNLTEADAVATVICAESRGEGRPGMVAVGEVIRTRADHKGVSPARVLRRGAFSTLNHTTLGALHRRMAHLPEYAEALRIGQLVCRQPDKLPGLTRGADHFTRAEERPYWSKGHQPVVVIGHHAFYRLGKWD
jgi:spore germination cell wall hydrolase CwlJ-like protein